ncbi:restriction endonuclease subunit S [Paenibacillus sp. GCM10023252]|uniref:restriction endonuclease subunit S n=1 Tax=Paenibacillus sp. GCM10023252 TaxID=3252649 RepID=UPI00361C297C
MSEREQAYRRMLTASASLQWNVAMILEAKALEAEKVRNWLCNHVNNGVFEAHQDQLKETMLLHDEVIDVIDGVTKLSQGMVSVLKAVLGQDGEGGSFSGGGMMYGGNAMEFGDKD